MSKRVAKSIKEKVAKRANNCCEYCLLSERVSFYKFHIEHIRSLKHGGSSDLNNLAYGCPDCNAFKGSDIATFIENTDLLTRFSIQEKTAGKTTLRFKMVLFTVKQQSEKQPLIFLNLMM